MMKKFLALSVASGVTLAIQPRARKTTVKDDIADWVNPEAYRQFRSALKLSALSRFGDLPEDEVGMAHAIMNLRLTAPEFREIAKSLDLNPNYFKMGNANSKDHEAIKAGWAFDLASSLALKKPEVIDLTQSTDDESESVSRSASETSNTSDPDYDPTDESESEESEESSKSDASEDEDAAATSTGTDEEEESLEESAEKSTSTESEPSDEESEQASDDSLKTASEELSESEEQSGESNGSQESSGSYRGEYDEIPDKHESDEEYLDTNSGETQTESEEYSDESSDSLGPAAASPIYPDSPARYSSIHQRADEIQRKKLTKTVAEQAAAKAVKLAIDKKSKDLTRAVKAFHALREVKSKGKHPLAQEAAKAAKDLIAKKAILEIDNLPALPFKDELKQKVLTKEIRDYVDTWFHVIAKQATARAVKKQIDNKGPVVFKDELVKKANQKRAILDAKYNQLPFLNELKDTVDFQNKKKQNKLMKPRSVVLKELGIDNFDKLLENSKKRRAAFEKRKEMQENEKMFENDVNVAVQVEKRIASDGESYTKDEYLAHYPTKREATNKWFHSASEKRLDQDDLLYTKQEFLEFYGGYDEWDRSLKESEVDWKWMEHRLDQNDGSVLPKQAFIEKYGYTTGSDEWYAGLDYELPQDFLDDRYDPMDIDDDYHYDPMNVDEENQYLDYPETPDYEVPVAPEFDIEMGLPRTRGPHPYGSTDHGAGDAPNLAFLGAGSTWNNEFPLLGDDPDGAIYNQFAWNDELPSPQNDEEELATLSELTNIFKPFAAEKTSNNPWKRFYEEDLAEAEEDMTMSAAQIQSEVKQRHKKAKENLKKLNEKLQKAQSEKSTKNWNKLAKKAGKMNDQAELWQKFFDGIESLDTSERWYNLAQASEALTQVKSEDSWKRIGDLLLKKENGDEQKAIENWHTLYNAAKTDYESKTTFPSDAKFDQWLQEDIAEELEEYNQLHASRSLVENAVSLSAEIEREHQKLIAQTKNFRAAMHVPNWQMLAEGVVSRDNAVKRWKSVSETAQEYLPSIKANRRWKSMTTSVVADANFKNLAERAVAMQKNDKKWRGLAGGLIATDKLQKLAVDKLLDACNNRKWQILGKSVVAQEKLRNLADAALADAYNSEKFQTLAKGLKANDQLKNLAVKLSEKRASEQVDQKTINKAEALVIAAQKAANEIENEHGSLASNRLRALADAAVADAQNMKLWEAFSQGLLNKPSLDKSGEQLQQQREAFDVWKENADGLDWTDYYTAPSAQQVEGPVTNSKWRQWAEEEIELAFKKRPILQNAWRKWTEEDMKETKKDDKTLKLWHDLAKQAAKTEKTSDMWQSLSALAKKNDDIAKMWSNLSSGAVSQNQLEKNWEKLANGLSERETMKKQPVIENAAWRQWTKDDVTDINKERKAARNLQNLAKKLKIKSEDDANRWNLPASHRSWAFSDISDELAEVNANQNWEKLAQGAVRKNNKNVKNWQKLAEKTSQKTTSPSSKSKSHPINQWAQEDLKEALETPGQKQRNTKKTFEKLASNLLKRDADKDAYKNLAQEAAKEGRLFAAKKQQAAGWKDVAAAAAVEAKRRQDEDFVMLDEDVPDDDAVGSPAKPEEQGEGCVVM